MVIHVVKKNHVRMQGQWRELFDDFGVRSKKNCECLTQWKMFKVPS